MDTETTSSRIKRSRKELGYTQQQVADAIGVNRVSITNWERGESNPRGKNLSKLAKLLQCEQDWILYGANMGTMTANMSDLLSKVKQDTPNEDPPESDYLKVRRFNVELSAGHGSFVDDEQVIDELYFRKDWVESLRLNPEHLVVLQARGDSMAPRIQSGDVVLTDLSDCKIIDGKIYAIRIEDQLIIKRIHLNYDGSLIIHSDNNSPEYCDMTVAKDNIKDINILGRILWVAGLL
ncbi:MAG: helix-turn-helix domain-containing protein [Methylococcales bacterium]|jgi:phage repressor protein C with HTH and peptisase S24 domain|nr:helix-turn-helix domain-containing protein [Methylococcales bacterium]MBT7444776.1 helix-turn-helix domain-containing protein [Methylococcales bacterium]